MDINEFKSIYGNQVAFVVDKLSEIREAFTNEGVPFSYNSAHEGVYFQLKRKLRQVGKKKKEHWKPVKNEPKKYKNKEIFEWYVLPLTIELKKANLSYTGGCYKYLEGIECVDSENYNRKSMVCVLLTVDGYGRITHVEEIVETGIAGTCKDWKHLPRSVFNKMNCALYENCFDMFSIGKGYGCWYKNRAQRILHLGNRAGPYCLSDNYINELKELLKTSLESVVLVLLSYTAFSILQPFYRKYKPLTKNADSGKIQAMLGNQLGFVLIQHEFDDYYLKRILDFCFGGLGINNMTLSGVNVIEKLDTISRKAYESAFLKLGCPFFICLVREKCVKIKDLAPLIVGIWRVDESYPRLSHGNELISVFTKQIAQRGNEKMQKEQTEIEKKCKRYVEKLEKEICEAAKQKYFPDYMPDCLRQSKYCKHEVPYNVWDYPKPLSNFTLSLVLQYITEVQQQCYKDIEYMHKEHKKGCRCSDEEKEIIDYLWEGKKEHIDKLCRQAKSSVLKCYKDVSYDALYYDKKVQESLSLLKKTIAPCYVEKAAYLHASFELLCEYCELDFIERDKLLEAFNILFKNPRLAPQDELEAYLLQCMQEDACARIRGVNSEKASIKLWYDTAHQLLLLPSQRYWSECVAFVYPGIQKKAWETSLKDILDTCDCGKQKRRTFPTCVHAQGSRISVLRVKVNKLSEGFRNNDIVKKTIQKCIEDKSPLRSPDKAK